ncbi:hypothetical protein [Amphritea sp.]|uniref:hypothetical protein n=1 Tax=Amphritea sp. TaxID=1872502 RepID=UPI003D0CCD52
MKIAVFILEMVVGVLPATLLAPAAILGSMFSIFGAANGWENIFNPFGILGILGLAGIIGLWLVVLQNAFKTDFKPGKVHLTLLSLGMLSALPIAYIAIFISEPNETKDFYFILCFLGPLIVASKYLYHSFRKRHLTN